MPLLVLNISVMWDLNTFTDELLTAYFDKPLRESTTIWLTKILPRYNRARILNISFECLFLEDLKDTNVKKIIIQKTPFKKISKKSNLLLHSWKWGIFTSQEQRSGQKFLKNCGGCATCIEPALTNFTETVVLIMVSIVNLICKCIEWN